MSLETIRKGPENKEDPKTIEYIIKGYYCDNKKEFKPYYKRCLSKEELNASVENMILKHDLFNYNIFTTTYGTKGSSLDDLR